MDFTSIWSRCVLATLMVAPSAWSAPMTYDPGGLNFISEDQSMWGPGPAFQLDETYFVGETWNSTTTFGGFANLPGTGGTIPNPAYGVWWAAMQACLATGLSQGTCENGAIGVPGLGSAPPTTIANPVPAVKTGMEVTLGSTGMIGFEFGVKIDSGSVNANVAYDNITATIPDVEQATAQGGLVDLNPTASLTGDDLNSQFPTIVLTTGLVFDVSASVSGEACAGVCVPFSDSMNVDPDLPIVSFNEDGEGGIEWFGGDSVLESIINIGGGSLPSGFPAEDIEIAGGLMEVDLFFPQPNTTYDGSDGTSLFSSGQDDLFNVTVDLDNIASLVATSGATQNTFGGDVDVGFGSASWDFIDVDVGFANDLVQEFELTPTLMVDLEFSQPVNFLGEWVTFVEGIEWASIPEILFAMGETVVTPTFYLQYGMDPNTVQLLNELILDINGLLEIDILEFGFTLGKDFGALGNWSLSDSWSLLSIVEEFDIGQIPLWDSTFGMGGFNEILADSFRVLVPEPGSLLLFLLGLAALGRMTHRRKA